MIGILFQQVAFAYVVANHNFDVRKELQTFKKQ